jgi:hypothetical protein
VAYDTAVRKKVRANYVQGMALTSAASAANVPYNTARTWKRQEAEAGDDWDIARASRRMTKSGVEELVNQVLPELAEQFVATIKALKADHKIKPADRGKILVQLMDGYGKAISASTRGSPNSNRLATALDVIKVLTDLFAKHHPKLRPQFVHAVEQFGPELMRHFSSGAT